MTTFRKRGFGRLLASFMGTAVVLAIFATAASANEGPYRWPPDVDDNFGQEGNDVNNGWRYFLNDLQSDEHFVPMQYDEATDQWLDSTQRQGSSNARVVRRQDGGYEIRPDGMTKIKLAVHPNINLDQELKGDNWILRIRARALPGGCSLAIVVVPSDPETGEPNPDALRNFNQPGGARFLKGGRMIGDIEPPTDYLFEPNQPIDLKIPVKLGVDMVHCEWLVMEWDDPSGGGGNGGNDGRGRPDDGDPDEDEPPWLPICEFYPAGCPLLTEIVTTPGAQFIEIWNPWSWEFDLANPFGVPGGTYLSNSRLYYGMTTGDGSVDTLSGTAGFFNAQFPPGFTIAPGGYAVVAVDGSSGFMAEYSTPPDFELFEDGAGADSVPDMVPAFAGSIPGTSTLSGNDGTVTLFEWDGFTDLICDCDYAHWGSTPDVLVDKTGVMVDGVDPDAIETEYDPDTPQATQVPMAISPMDHMAGETFHRRQTIPWEMESLVRPNNGCLDMADETSEELNVTWFVGCGPTPGMGPPEKEAPCEVIGPGPIFTVYSPPRAVKLPTALPKGARLIWRVRAAPKGPKTEYAMKVKKKQVKAGEAVPKTGLWRKILRLMADGGTVDVILTGKGDTEPETLDELTLGPAEGASGLSPNSTEPQSTDSPPTFMWTGNEADKCFLEIATDPEFSNVVQRIKVKNGTKVPLKSGKWKKLLKKLAKKGGEGTAYWRVRCTDPAGRETTDGEGAKFGY